MPATEPPPLVLHVVHRFDTGGLENGLANLINHMPREAYRHAIVALTEVTDFRHRVQREDVSFHALNKPPGQGFWLFPAFWRLLRQLRPAIVHTRNLGTLEFQWPAALAGVPARVHGEHGWDIDDLDGSNRRHQWSRKLCRPLVHRQIALSRDLQDYLVSTIGVPPERITQIFNGVDVQRFQPVTAGKPRPDGCPFDPQQHWVVGTVGRMQPVKHQTLLVQAFVAALREAPEWRPRLRLLLVGGGPLQARCEALLREAGMSDCAWLAGERQDVPQLMQAMDLFVLPSLAEGVSNTLLEAMACGLPTVATDVGANADLLVPGQTGSLVPSDDLAAMRDAIVQAAREPSAAQAMGHRGRQRVEAGFSMTAMAQRYRAVYDGALRGRRTAA